MYASTSTNLTYPVKSTNKFGHSLLLRVALTVTHKKRITR